MQKSQVISAPVISIDTGEALGKVSNVMLDPVEQVVSGLIFGEGRWFSHGPSFMINLFDIQTIGPYAITIPHEHVIMQLDKGEFNKSQQFRAPEDKQVISDHGELLGICKDYEFNFPTGELTSLIISDQHGTGQDFAIPGEQIMTLGTDYIIISYHLVHANDCCHPDSIHSFTHQYYHSPEELLGKVVTQTIQDGFGNILITEGELITPELLDLAMEHNLIHTLAVVASYNGAEPFANQQKIIEDPQPFQYKYHEEGNRQFEDIHMENKGLSFDTEEQDEWQTKLKSVLNQKGSDIEEKLKSFLISKRPAYTVYAQSGELLKEKGKPIQVRDIQKIQDKNDLLRLTASITASELSEFMTFIEGKVQKLINNHK